MTFPRCSKSALALSVALSGAGCYLTPGDFERSADREVDQILAEGTRQALGGREESVLRPEEIAPEVEAEPREESEASGPMQDDAQSADQAPVEEPLEPVRVLSLAEALEIAVTTGRDYVTRREGLYLTALGISGTRFDFGPRLSGALSYVFADSEAGPISQDASLGASVSHVLPFGGDVSASGSTASARSSGSGSFSSGASIRLTQPLLRGFGHEIAYEALTQAERNLIYAIRDFELFREGYSIRIARDYYNLVQTKREVANQESSLERLTFQRRKAEALYEVDRAEDLDVVRARRDELNSKNDLIQAQEEYEAQLDRFRIALGLPKTQPVDVRPEDPEFVPVNFDRESAIEVAYANRLDYLTQKDRIEDSARSLRISRNALLPSLGLDAGYNLSGSPDASFLQQSFDDASWSVGLSLGPPAAAAARAQCLALGADLPQPGAAQLRGIRGQPGDRDPGQPALHRAPEEHARHPAGADRRPGARPARRAHQVRGRRDPHPRPVRGRGITARRPEHADPIQGELRDPAPGAVERSRHPVHRRARNVQGMKTTIVILALVALAAGWRFYGVGAAAAAGEVSADAVFEVRRDTLKITVSENGYLKAKNNTEIKPEFRRSATITWLIDEGEQVEEGDKLAEFEKTDLENELAETSNQLIQYETELAAAQAEVEIQVRDNAAAIEAAEFAKELATLKRERYLEGDGPNELRKLKLAVDKATSDYERAKEKYAQVPLLLEEKFMTKDAAEEERIRLQEMSINKQNAEEDLRLYKKYNEPMQRTELSNAVKDAERQLTNAKEKAEINLAEKRALVTRKERQVNSTRQDKEKLEEQLGFMTITAPSPGVIHYGDPARPWMRDEVKVGNNFHRGNALFTLPDLREMQVLVQVHEADIDMLDEDMDVIVTVEASKGNLFPAKVTHIATVATSDWSDEANKTFRVEITMEPIEVKLRAGITATAEVMCEEIPDVLVAPIHTVIVGGRRALLFRAQRDRDRAHVWSRPGKNNAHYVIIDSGLAEGEKVLLYDPREAGMVESKKVRRMRRRVRF